MSSATHRFYCRTSTERILIMHELNPPIFIESAFSAPFYNKAMLNSINSAVEWLNTKIFIDKTLQYNLITLMKELFILNQNLLKKYDFPIKYKSDLPELCVFYEKAEICCIECVVHDRYLVSYNSLQTSIDELCRAFADLYGKSQLDKDKDRFRFIFVLIKELYQDNRLMYREMFPNGYYGLEDYLSKNDGETDV